MFNNLFNSSTPEPYYKIWMGVVNKNAPQSTFLNIPGLFTEITASGSSLRKAIVSLSVTRSWPGSGGPLATASIMLKEGMSDMFFSGMPGFDQSGKIQLLGKVLQPVRIVIEIGYRNPFFGDLVGAGHYYPGTYSPQNSGVISGNCLLYPSATVIIGVLRSPTIAAGPDGMTIVRLTIEEPVPTSSTLLDSQNSVTHPIQVIPPDAQVEKLRAVLGNKFVDKGQDFRLGLTPYKWTPTIAEIGAVFLLERIVEQLFFSIDPKVLTEQLMKFDFSPLYLDPDFLAWPTAQGGWNAAKEFVFSFDPSTQSRWAFLQDVCKFFQCVPIVAYKSVNTVICTFYPFSKAGKPPMFDFSAQNLGFVPPIPGMIFALNAVYGVNVLSYDFSNSSPTGTAPISVGTAKTDKGEVTTLYVRNEQKIKAWMEQKKAEGIGELQIRILAHQFAATASSDEIHKQWYDPWDGKTVPGEQSQNPAAAAGFSGPMFNQKLSLKWRFGIPGMVPGCAIHFIGPKISRDFLDVFFGIGGKESVLPEQVVGRYRVDTVTWNFDPNGLMTMDTTCMR